MWDISTVHNENVGHIGIGTCLDVGSEIPESTSNYKTQSDRFDSFLSWISAVYFLDR